MQAVRNFERETRSPAGDTMTGYKRLAGGVVLRAMQEASRGDIEALDWLEDRQAPTTWLDMADIRRVDLFRWIVSGCPKFAARREGFHKARSDPTQDFDTYDNPEVETRRRMANNG